MAADVDAQDRRAYLGFIENAITRMANEANTLKAWLVPVVTAAYGYAIISRSWVIALVGIVASIVLGWQAAHYLRQEHAYRDLYDSAVTGKSTMFDMNIKRKLHRTKGTALASETVAWWPVVRSWSVGGFFGLLALGGIVIMVGVLLAR